MYIGLCKCALSYTDRAKTRISRALGYPMIKALLVTVEGKGMDQNASIPRFSLHVQLQGQVHVQLQDTLCNFSFAFFFCCCCFVPKELNFLDYFPVDRAPAENVRKVMLRNVRNLLPRSKSFLAGMALIDKKKQNHFCLSCLPCC